MRTYFLLGGVNLTAISVLGGQAFMMLALIVRDQGSIPIEAQNFFGLCHLIISKIMKNHHPSSPLKKNVSNSLLTTVCDCQYTVCVSSSETVHFISASPPTLAAACEGPSISVPPVSPARLKEKITACVKIPGRFCSGLSPKDLKTKVTVV